MLSLSSVRECRVVAISQGELVVRRLRRSDRPWQLLTFPPAVTGETIECLEAAACACPSGAEVLAVAPTMESLLHPALRDCHRVIIAADPLGRIHRAFSVWGERSHAESFLLSGTGLLQFMLVHRLPGPALSAMAELLSLLLADGHTARQVEAELETLCSSGGHTPKVWARAAAEVS